uniref:Nuclear RNA export factor 2 n=1 Tax=Castor canadensis TaxID=51338 RepID=A0A8C0WI08_CASCN
VLLLLFPISEHSGDSSVLQGRKRSGRSFQGSFGRRNGHYEEKHNGYILPPSKLQEDDGNVEMRDVHEDPKVRYSPYATQCNKQRRKWRNEGKIHVAVWRDTNRREREMEQDTQDGAMQSWFKVTIPFGRKYDKTWLMNSIQRHCIVPFTPIDFHYDKNRARFFVQDARAASALKDVSYRICNEEGRKILLTVIPSSIPYSVQNKFTAEQMEQLKLTMKKRYDVSQQSLDLQKLRFDPDLKGQKIDMVLNRRYCMFATLQIIQRNFPELSSLNLCNNKLYGLDGLSDVVEKAPQVKILNLSKNQLKSALELNKLKGMKLEELWLEGNPFCRIFLDQSVYVSAIRDCFPTLLRLDGQELSPPVAIDIDAPVLINPYKEGYGGSESLKNIVLRFLQEYYLTYDYGDRRSLLSVYHDEACFSLTIPFNPSDPDPNSLCDYFKHSRNMKNLKDSCQLLKHKKLDIVDSLSVLPKTQHDFSSFFMDMWLQMETMLCFSVNGVFKEGESLHSRDCFSYSLCIVNDQLFVRNANPDEIRRVCPIPLPTICSSSKPTLSQEQQQMVQAFSVQSGMKVEWSQK